MNGMNSKINDKNKINVPSVAINTNARNASATGSAVKSKQNEGSNNLARRLRDDYYGVSRARALQICEEFGYLPNTNLNRISKEAITRIYAYARSEGMVREIMQQRIKRSNKANTVASIRMRRGLPTRGQRTQTNASTASRLNSQR